MANVSLLADPLEKMASAAALNRARILPHGGGHKSPEFV
jgi:hypothetical protein